MNNFSSFQIIKKCNKTNARVSKFKLSNELNLPIFMPVGTYGAIKSIPMNSKNILEEIILSNTYHLRNLNKNIKEFAKIPCSLLTDSGGFQIQSLPCRISDDGVEWLLDNSKILFTPEDSMRIQMCLGADIIMQLDDVVNPLRPYEEHRVAVDRSILWLDRAIRFIHLGEKAHPVQKVNETENEIKEYSVKRVKEHSVKRTKKSSKTPADINRETENMDAKKDSPFMIKNNQILFPIIQGGLIEELRLKSLESILERNPIGLAIGGLSGGENKKDFCRIVYFTINELRKRNYNGPVYVMGIGYADDIIICCALGSDMSDCVYPTRTARFGRILCDKGDINIDNKILGNNNKVLSNDSKIGFYTECDCKMCSRYTLPFMLNIKGTPNFCTLMSEHNLKFMRNLTKNIRNSILENRFVEFMKDYFKMKYKESIPEWIMYAYELLGIKE